MASGVVGYVIIVLFFLQAEVEGQKITWLTPHALQQVLPEVDYRVLLTFLEFYEVGSYDFIFCYLTNLCSQFYA